MSGNEDDEKALRFMEEDPEKFLKSCKSGPLVETHFKVLSENAQRIPKAHAQETLGILCSYIKSPTAPSSSKGNKGSNGHGKGNSQSQQNLALLSLGGIANMAPLLQADSSLRSKLKSSLTEITRYFQQMPQDSKERRLLVADVLLVLTGCEGVPGTLAKDSAIRALAINAWLELDESSEEKPMPSSVSTNVLNILIHEYSAKFGNHDLFLREILSLSSKRKGHKSTVKMAIRQVRTMTDLASSEDDKKAIIPPLEVLLILAQDSTLCKLLVEGGELATIFKSAVALFDGTSPRELAAKKGSNFHVKDFFHNLFTMLKNLSMQIMECVTPISDAIDAGMLRLVAHACDTLDLLNQNTTFFITGILFRFIRLLLVHSSIMLATAREIKRLRTMPCAKKLTSSMFRDEWRSFQDAVLVHYTMLRYREIVLSETQKRRQCDGCQKMDFKDSFQCCGKCKNAFYCSKECQLKGWKGGHKQQCNDLVGSRGKDVVGTKNISYLLALELKRHWPSIQRNPTVEKVPFSQLVFDLNWTSMSVPPMKFKVYTIDQLMKKLVSERDFTEISMLKEMQTLTEGSMNALAVTRISVITGYSTRTSYSSIGKTELLSSKLERPADAEVRFTRPVALDADDSDKELTDCIWDEVDEAIHRLGLPKDGSLLVEDAQGKQVHAFTMIDRVLRSPTFPIPMNIRLAKSFEQFKNQ